MRRLSLFNCGLSVGIVIGLWHLAWAVLVASNLAEPLLDFVLRLHFLQFSYSLMPFSPTTAAMLVSLTFGVGFAFGLIFAAVWNWLAGPQTAEGRQPGRAIADQA